MFLVLAMLLLRAIAIVVFKIADKAAIPAPKTTRNRKELQNMLSNHPIRPIKVKCNVGSNSKPKYHSIPTTASTPPHHRHYTLCPHQKSSTQPNISCPKHPPPTWYHIIPICHQLEIYQCHTPRSTISSKTECIKPLTLTPTYE